MLEQAQHRTGEMIVLAILVGGLLACLSLLLALVARGDASVVATGTVGVGAGIFGFLLTRPAEIRAKAALLTTSFGLLIYFAELLFMATAPDLLDSLGDGVTVDRRSKLQVLADRREEGVEVWALVHPHLFIQSDGLQDGGMPLFPLSGISRVNTVYCNEMGTWVEFKADGHGFNNPTATQDLQRPDLVVIGDSFVQGKCVEPGNDVAGRLRSANFSVVSLGVGGTGPLAELAVLSEYGLPLQPETVLWVYFEGNDLVNLKGELTAPTLRKYLDDENFSQRLRARRPEIDGRLKAEVEARERREREDEANTFVNVLKLHHLRARFGLSVGRPPPSAEFRAVLRAARKRSERAGAAFAFVYLPEFLRYKQGRGGDGEFADREAVLQMLREEGIDLIDFTDVLDRHSDPLSVFATRAGGHYNEEGYRLLAELIARTLGDE